MANPANPKENQISVTFVVSGQAVPYTTPPSKPLRAAVHQILAETKNTGQPIENWVLTLDGKELNLDQTFAEASVKNGSKLFLNIRSGRGGSVL